MASGKPADELLVVGVHLASEGYPNTLYRLNDLKASGSFLISEINVPMWTDGTRSRQGLARITRNLGRAIHAHASVFYRYCKGKRPELAYVPYPAIFVVALLSLLPRRLRPKTIVIDAFISIYDTVVNDRKILAEDGMPARILKCIERRAYRCADKLVVDTEQNAEFLCKLFALPAEKVKTIPLSTNEIQFKPVPYRPGGDIVRVLFVGTLIPLHGIQTILDACAALASRRDIRFRIVGDGQDARLVENWIASHPSGIEWKRAWQSSEQLANEIASADICLGIFGTGDKANRVCPLKIYAYSAIGRPVITADTDWLRDQKRKFGRQVFTPVVRGDPAALAAAIAGLADSPDQRIRQAEASRKFYEMRLSNSDALKMLKDYLLNR